MQLDYCQRRAIEDQQHDANKQNRTYFTPEGMTKINKSAHGRNWVPLSCLFFLEKK